MVSIGQKRVFRLLRALCACGLLLPVAAPVSLAQAPTAEQSLWFDLPSSSLSQALATFSKKTGLVVLVSGGALDGEVSEPLKGDLTLSAALKLLLRKTKLTFEFTRQNTVVIRPAARQSTKQRQPRMRTAALTMEQDTTGTDFWPEEINITATRRATNIQLTGHSVTAVAGSHLVNRGHSHIGDFIDSVPGVAATADGPNATQIVIRNVATDVGQEGRRSTTAVYWDDIAIRDDGLLRPAALNIRLVDMKRVEILKGPQGTYFGRGAMGGVVRLIPNHPDPGIFEGGVYGYASSVADGGFNKGGNGYLNIPIADTLAVRLVGYSYQDAGFLDNIELGQQNYDKENTWGGRIALRWQPNDSFVADLTYLNQYVKGALSRVTTTRAADGTAIPYDIKGRQNIGAILPTDTNSREIWGLRLRQDFSQFHVKLQAARSRYQASTVFDMRESFGLTTGCVCSFLENGDNDTGGNDTLEVRFVSSNDGAIDWLAGLYYEKSAQSYRQLTQLFDEDPQRLVYRQRTDGIAIYDFEEDFLAKETAIYGEVGLNIGAGTRLSIGFRRSHLTSQTELVRADGLWDGLDTDSAELNGALMDWRDHLINQTPLVRPGSIWAQLESSNSELVGSAFKETNNNNAYKFSFEQRFSGNLFAYATTSSGYRRGGVNLPRLGVPFSTFKPDTVWGYELGVRSNWFDGRFTANVSAYRVDFSDIQLEVCNCAVTTENVGRARMQGIEYSAGLQVTDYLGITFSGSFSDAKLLEDVPNGVQGKKGDRFPGTMTENFSATADWQLPIGGGHNVTSSVSYRYVGPRLNDFGPADASKAPAYQLVDLQLGFRTESGYRLSLFVNNLFDEAIAYYVAKQGANFESVPTNRPRTVGIGFSYDF